MPSTRREFLIVSSLAAASGLRAASRPTIAFPTAPRDRLAVASYPFRAFLDTPRNRQRNPQAALIPLKDFPAQIVEKFQIHNVELLGDHISANDPAFMDELHAALKSAKVRVIDIPAGVGGSIYDPDESRRATAVENARKWIDTAVSLDCPSVRIHLQGPRDTAPDAALTAASLASIAQYGESKNVVVNLENDDIHTEDAFFLAKVIDQVNSPWLRALPDFCNSMLKGDEKFNYDAVTEMFRRAYNISHAKDVEVEGTKVFRVDLERTFAIARSAGYKGYFSMEFEGQGDPYAGTQKLIEESLKYLR